jgi:NitT/TauT family transport system substrate-binding protein
MRDSRRRFLGSATLFAASALLPACGARPPLTIASHVWPGYEFMFLARSEGWLPQQGLALLETASATLSLQALRDGRAQGAALTLDEVLRARAEGVPLTVVLVFDVSAGADALIARPDIGSLAALRGRRVGAETSALGAFMLGKVLRAGGLAMADVHIVPLTPDNHLRAWREGMVDALITYEPTASLLLAEGGTRLFDSRQMQDTIFDVLAVRPEAANAHADALKALIAGHFRGLAHLRGNPQDAGYRLAGRMRLSGHEVLQAFRGLKLPDALSNHAYLDGRSDSGLVHAARELSAVMVDARLLSRPDSLTDIVCSQYLPTPEAG